MRLSERERQERERERERNRPSGPARPRTARPRTAKGGRRVAVAVAVAVTGGEGSKWGEEAKARASATGETVRGAVLASVLRGRWLTGWLAPGQPGPEEEGRSGGRYPLRYAG